MKEKEKFFSNSDRNLIIVVLFFAFIIVSIISTCVITITSYQKTVKNDFCDYAIENKLLNHYVYANYRGIDSENILNYTEEELCEDIYLRYLLSNLNKGNK